MIEELYQMALLGKILAKIQWGNVGISQYCNYYTILPSLFRRSKRLLWHVIKWQSHQTISTDPVTMHICKLILLSDISERHYKYGYPIPSQAFPPPPIQREKYRSQLSKPTNQHLPTSDRSAKLFCCQSRVKFRYYLLTNLSPSDHNITDEY